MKYLITFCLILSIVFGCSSTEYVEILDENLAAAIRDNIGLNQNDTITRRKLNKLTKLSGPQRNIRDLSGLQHAKRLRTLELYGNQIQDISLLADLKKLTRLNLSNNKITDISSLNGLKELTYLALEQNQIQNITPLENLTNLKYLFINQNPIKDLSSIEDLPVADSAEDTSPIQQVTDIKQYDTQIALPDGAITRFGKGGINTMRFSLDGTLLAVGTDIGVWLYDRTSGEAKPLQANSLGQSNAIAFSSNGRILASGGSSNPILQLWDISTGAQLPYISLPTSKHLHLMNKKDGTHEKSVAALSFPKSKGSLLSLSYAGSFNYWNITTGKELSKHRTDFDSEGVLALSQNGSNFACGYWNGEIWIGDATTGKLTVKLKGHGRSIKFLSKNTKYRRVRALTFSTDGKLLASGSEDKTVQIWSINRYKKLATLKGHKGWVSALTFSEDGKYLASGGTESNVHLWDVDKKRNVAVFEGHTNGILAMAFSSDGKTLATGGADGTIRFWDVNAQKADSIFATGHTEWVRDISFSLDNSKVSVANYNATAEIWDIKSASQLDVFNINPQKISYAIALSPDGSHLASHNIEGNITFNVDGWDTVIEYYNSDKTRLWNLDDKTELPPIPGVFGDMAFSPDNEILACKSLEDVLPWQKTTDSEVGRRLSSVVGRSKEILITKVRTGTELNRIHVGKRGGPLSGGGLYADISLMFSPEGSIFAAGRRIWNMDTWEQLPIFTPENTAIMAFSKNSQFLAIQKNRTYDKDISVWNIFTLNKPQKLKTIELPYTLENRALTLSPNGAILVESTKMAFDTYCEANISLWDVNTGEKLLSLPGHTEPIETLVFSHDGKILASGSEDGTVLLWDWNKILAKIKPDDR